MLTEMESPSLRIKKGRLPHQKIKKIGKIRCSIYVTGGFLLASYLLFSQSLLSLQTAVQDQELAPTPTELTFHQYSDPLVLENDEEHELDDTGRHSINQTDEYRNRRILDQVARDELPIIYPNTFLATDGDCFGEVVHAEWPQPTGKALRLYGLGPDAMEPPHGETVKGDWPDLLDKLTYVPILKNGHTSLANAFGDLRQRLNGSSELLKWMKRPGQPKTPSWRNWFLRQELNINEAYSSLLNWAENNPKYPHKFFTVLRDPIDRFISASCEELRQGAPYRKRCLRPHWNDTLNCTIHYLPTNTGAHDKLKKFKPHQELQTKQLYIAVRGRNVGMAVIPFTSLSELLNELGCSTHSMKVRDRASSQYTKKTIRTKVVPKKENLQRMKHSAAFLGKINRDAAALTAMESFREMVHAKKRNKGRRRRLAALALDKFSARSHLAKKRNERTALWQNRENERMTLRHSSDEIHHKPIPKTTRRLPSQPKTPMLTASSTRAKADRMMKTARVPPPRSSKTMADQYLSDFCQIQAQNLSEGQLYQLCEVYHRDVELMESVGMAVPHCSKYMAKVGPRGFQVERGQ